MECSETGVQRCETIYRLNSRSKGISDDVSSLKNLKASLETLP